MTILLYSLFSLLVFTLTRIGIYITYFRPHRAPGIKRLLWIMRRGFSFDASVFVIIYGLFIVLAMLPFQFAHNTVYRYVIYSVWYFLFVIEIGVLTGDFLYFKYVGRHITFEANMIFTEGDMMFRLLLKEYKLVVAIVTGFILITAYFWFKLPDIFYSHNFPGYSTAGFRFLVSSFLVLFFAHGNKLKGKPIATVDANFQATRFEAILIMNGLFSTIHYFYNIRGRKSVKVMEDSKAVKIVRDISGASATNKYPQYPLMRSGQDNTSLQHYDCKPNIAIIVAEGLASNAIPCLYPGKESQWQDIKVMPFTNKMAKQAWSFTNFYSNGQRTIDMVHTLLTSMPRMGGVPLIGYDHDFSNVNYLYLPQILKKNGYETYAYNGPWARSIHMDSIASVTGFDHYIAGEDINSRYLKKSGLPRSEVGAWDEHIFNAVYEDLKLKTEPYFSVIFTATTHAPYDVPDKKYELYGVNSDKKRYLNGLRYLDGVLENFFQKTDNDPNFRDTIFFIVADHVLFRETNEIDDPYLFHVPFMIYNKKHIQHRIDKRIASHMDIFPTTLDMVSNNHRHVNFGRSLLRNDLSPFAVMQHGDMIHATDGERWSIFRDIKLKPETYRVSEGLSLEKYVDPKFKALELITMAYYQSTNTLFNKNAYYPANDTHK